MTGGTEQTLLPHVSCQDTPSKSLKQQSVESPGLLLILALSIADSHWLQLACIQHFWVFYLLQAFQNVDRYQQIPSYLWSIGTTILSGFTHRIIPKSLLNHSNSFRGWMSKFEAKLDADSLIYSPGHCECDSNTINKLAQRCLTATWLAPRESNCARMRSRVSSDQLPVTSRPRDQFSRYSKWLDTFRTDLIPLSGFQHLLKVSVTFVPSFRSNLHTQFVQQRFCKRYYIL